MLRFDRWRPDRGVTSDIQPPALRLTSQLTLERGLMGERPMSREPTRAFSARFSMGRSRLAAVAGFSVMFLGGCMVGPDFIKPDAPEYTQWMAEREAYNPVEAPEDALWWKKFEDPALDALIDAAIANNPQLEIAALRVLEARARLGVAIGRLYPQTQALTGGYKNTTLDAPNATPPLDIDQTNYELGFNLSWEADFFGKFRRGIESGEANLNATFASYDNVLVILCAQVASAYVLLRATQERLEFARSNVSIQERSLEIATVRFESELTSELDVQQARTLLKHTEAFVPILERLEVEVRNTLNELVGRAPSTLADLLADEPEEFPAAPERFAVGIPADLLRRRPDIRFAEYEAAQQSARIGVAKSRLYPAFTLGGAFSWGAPNVDDVFSSGGAVIGGGGIGFNWDFLNYGRIRNGVRVEDARFQQALANYEAAVLRAYKEVENSMFAIDATQREVAARVDGVVAAQRSVELSNIQYRDGLVDYTRVIQTQEALVSEQDSLAGARGKVLLAVVSLYRALGGGWEVQDGKQIISDEVQQEMGERTHWGRLLDNDKITAPVEPN